MNMKNMTNILIVDDKPQNIISLENVLQEDDVTIYKAYSGCEALELLLVHDFALAILDVQMPEMNGFELAELMRGKEQTKSIPIIFVTAGAIDPKFTFMGYDAGAVDFLYKPIDVRIVKSKVKVFKELAKQKQIIKNQIDQLSQALKWRDEFLSIASHELKTPLTTLSLQNQMALLKVGRENAPTSLDNAKLKQLFTNNGKQLSKLNRLIEDLLDTTKIKAGTLTVTPERINFSNLVKEVLDRYYEQLAHMKSINLKIEDSVFVNCDAFRTEQVIVNLISNAVKYAPNSDLGITLEKNKNQAILKIKDTGEGIPTDKLNSIFERFKRYNNNKFVNGLGLGLYIVKQIVEAHNGEIQVASENGKGTEFTVSFSLVH